MAVHFRLLCSVDNWMDGWLGGWVDTHWQPLACSWSWHRNQPSPLSTQLSCLPSTRRAKTIVCQTQDRVFLRRGYASRFAANGSVVPSDLPPPRHSSEVVGGDEDGDGGSIPDGAAVSFLAELSYSRLKVDVDLLEKDTKW